MSASNQQQARLVVVPAYQTVKITLGQHRSGEPSFCSWVQSVFEHECILALINVEFYTLFVHLLFRNH